MRLRGAALLFFTFTGALGSLVVVACGEDHLGLKGPEIDASRPDTGGGSSGTTSSGDSGNRPTHTVGGTVTGLAASKSVVLTLGDGNDVTVSSNAGFTFPTGVSEGAQYAVTVKAQPNLQKCVVTNAASGTMGTANVTNVAVDCSGTTCGDGIIDTASGEACDDGNTNDLDACTNLCAKGALSLGGNEKTYIQNALVDMKEAFTAVPAGASPYGAAPASGVFITSSDNTDKTFPTNWQTFLDAGGNILVIGGSNTAEYRTFIGGFLTLDATTTWHTSDDCTSDWNKIGAHAITANMPATFEFAEQQTGFHMTHFPSAGQPMGTVLLGETCHAAGNDAILATRTYASGGTFTYLAFDLGKFFGNGTNSGFTVPFLQGYLSYVRSKK
jgi:cysteine-rich repeat protein